MEAEYKRKLMGFNPDGPSREERMQQRRGLGDHPTTSNDSQPSPGVLVCLCLCLHVRTAVCQAVKVDAS